MLHADGRTTHTPSGAEFVVALAFAHRQAAAVLVINVKTFLIFLLLARFYVLKIPQSFYNKMID